MTYRSVKTGGWMLSTDGLKLNDLAAKTIEPRCEKTGLRGFRSGPTQTGLYSHRRWIEA